ncbi:hypothetical protein FZEAL_4405 [Fusarium zealandicum]|uniref:Uncharacterized protein n=1 Tax=Fusarium zealandicum TaxID=1053134 RepID=A0A8H4UMN3_9HYPO|nr:hypothetical protein FZEAL_4405 [Fusarium zealandicum]
MAIFDIDFGHRPRESLLAKRDRPASSGSTSPVKHVELESPRSLLCSELNHSRKIRRLSPSSPQALESLSLHAIIGKHGRTRLYTNPMEWTSEHLRLLRCQFLSEPISRRLPSPDLWETSVVPGPDDNPWSEADVSPSEGALTAIAYLRGKRKEFDLEYLMRGFGLWPSDCWLTNPALNGPLWQKQNIRFKRMQPLDKLQDPYIVAALIALAQQQRHPIELRTYEVDNVDSAQGDLALDTCQLQPEAKDLYEVFALVTGASDKALHLYHAAIPTTFLDKFDMPSQPSPSPILTIVHNRIALDERIVVLRELETLLGLPLDSQVAQKRQTSQPRDSESDISE